MWKFSRVGIVVLFAIGFCSATAATARVLGSPPSVRDTGHEVEATLVSCTRDGFRGVRQYKNCSVTKIDEQTWASWKKYAETRARRHNPDKFRGAKTPKG
jgi:hypothetical protein